MDKLSIVFDFGGVLIDWDPRYLYRKLFNGDEQAMERFFREVDFFGWNLYQDAGRSFDIAVAEACQKHPQYCEQIRAYDERYLETINGQIDGSVAILYRLKQSGYPLYGLSNWSAETFRFFSPKHEFFSWFDDILVSGEVKMVKPDPRIFAVFLERIGRSAAECLLIDDSQANLTVAARLGFKTIHFQSPEQLEAALKQFGLLDNSYQA